MELTTEKVLKLLRKNLLVLFLFAIIGAILGYGISAYLLPKSYQSNVEILITVSTDTNTSVEINNSYVASNKIVPNCVAILGTPDFKNQIKNELDLAYTPSIAVSNTNEETTIININAKASTAEEAFKTAKTAGELAPKKISSLYSGISVQVMNEAQVPQLPSSPGNRQNTILGALILLVITIFVILIREEIGIKVKNEEDLTARYGYPVIARIPNFDNVKAKGKQRGGKA